MITDVNWTSVPGKVLEGGYEIQELVAADQTGRTYKVRVLGDSSAHTVLKVFPGEEARAEEQIALWNSARELQHRNLSVPLAAGIMPVDGVSVAFVIVPRPDEVLEGILRERPLAPDEAKEVLLSASQALDYLHRKGFVHGTVSPEQVLAVGESIQLSTENVRTIGSGQGRGPIRAKYVAPEEAGANLTPEADVWCLGATIFEALTQQQYAEGMSGRTAELPGVFEGVVRRCLDPDPQARCKASEIPGLYRSQGSSNAKPELPPRRPEPAPPPTYSTRGPVKVLSDRHPRSRTPWIFGMLAFVLIIGLVWGIRRSRPQATASPVHPTGATSQPSLPGPAKNVSTKNFQANSPTQHAALRRTTKRNEDTKTVNGSIWRLVLYTYSHEKDAQNMAHILNEKHRELGATVFVPDGASSKYLVVAGGQMTYDQAARLRRKVEKAGLPRDSYVQNYSK